MESGTENLDATARVVRRIIGFTERGGVIHLVVYGVNVGAQSYWNALATMLGRTRGALVMTPDASMVLTGRAALEASGSVAPRTRWRFRRVRAHHGAERRGSTTLPTGAAFDVLTSTTGTYVVPGSSPAIARTMSARDVTTFA